MYQCAYPLKKFKNFKYWKQLHNQALTQDLADETVVFLRDNLTVHLDSLTQNQMIYAEITPEWLNFCQTELQFEPAKIQLHPFNKNFAWESKKGPFRFLTVEQANFYDSFGYVVIENVFNEETIASITQEIDQLEAKVEESLRKMDGGKGFIGRADEITFSTHLVKRSTLLRQFCGSKIFQDLSYDLIGPNVRLYWDHAVYKKPGVSKLFPWHQDNGYTFLEPQQYLTCWVALTDADENNGCFWTVPCLHKLGTIEHTLNDLGHTCYQEMPASAISLPIKKGGLIAMSAVLPHMTGPNYTQSTRKGYVIQFAPDGAYARNIDEKGNEVHVPANVENRQYIILKNGQAVNI